jgi:hypothetical protein
MEFLCADTCTPSVPIFYRYQGTVAQSLLAAIYHNHHLHREKARNAKGEIVFSLRWSKRAKRWILVSVKEAKDYAYMPKMCAKVLKALATESREKLTYEHDPVKVAPTIAPLPALPTSQLAMEHKSRF